MARLAPRNLAANTGTTAVIIFVAGAIILVLLIILILLFFKKRRAARTKTFIPRLERTRGGNYGKLEDDEEMAWSADMGEHERGKGTYAPVRDELLLLRLLGAVYVGVREGVSRK